MIDAAFPEPAHRFASRLAAQAGKLAAARLEARQSDRRDPARRWRTSRLLWPLFTES